MGTENILKEIEKLLRKAEVSRNAHSILHRRFKRYGSWLHFFILIGSSIIAILTFAGYETFLPLFPSWTDAGYKLGVGIFASIVFISTVVEEYLKFGTRVSAHENAIKQLTTFIRNAGVLKKKLDVTDEDLSALVTQYTTINEMLPSTPDEVFYKAKQGLRRKIEISKMLDKDPFISIKIYTLQRVIGQIVRKKRRGEQTSGDESDKKNEKCLGDLKRKEDEEIK